MNDFEFTAELENHPLNNQNIYRLYYLNYHRIGENYCEDKRNIGVTFWPFKPFMLPPNMSRDEAFKILSYLTDFIEKRSDIEPCSLKSVKMLDDILDLERFGFKRCPCSDETQIIDLFTVTGRILFFKKSKLYSKYFEWYHENVTKEEVEEIYAKYNMEFHDIVWLDKPEENKSRTLKI